MISNKRVVAIVQGRVDSSRLPGKVLMEVGGKPMLQYVVDRVRLASLVDEVVVATTQDASDDRIEELCSNLSIACYRGSTQDVLDRFYQAAICYQAEVVVRITGDCPLVDPRLIDETIRAREAHQADFCSNRLPPPFSRTFPIGLDVEVVTFTALETAWRNATEKHEREHVLPFLYEVPGRFHVFILDHEKDLGEIRWTVDTPADLEVVRQIIRQFDGKQDYSWLEVLDYYMKNKHRFRVNQNIKHKTYLDVDHRNK